MATSRTRSRRTPNRRALPIDQLPWGQPRLRAPFVEILSADEIEAIHQTSLSVLEEIGDRLSRR